MRGWTKRSLRRGTALPATLGMALASFVLGQAGGCPGPLDLLTPEEEQQVRTIVEHQVATEVDEAIQNISEAPDFTGEDCWDLNGNGIADPEEDVNGDGLFDANDCQGEKGAAGQDGDDGLHCWDVNGNGVGDPAEDTNGDGVVDVHDCAVAMPPPDCDECDDWFVNEGQPNSVSTTMIQGGAINLTKIAATGADDGKVLKTDGTGMYWGTDQTGDGGEIECAQCEDLFVSHGEEDPIETDMIQDTAVNSSKVEDNSLTADDLDANSVDSSEIVAQAVTAAKISSESQPQGKVLESDGSGGVSWEDGGGGNTLDEAYDEGGPGAGRTITADAGPVHIAATDGLTVDGPVSGSGFAGWDTDASDDLTTSTTFSGDVTGPFDATVVGNDSHTHSDSTVSDQLSIDNGRLYAPAGSGNVGIGISDPDEKLHVIGSIRTSIDVMADDDVHAGDDIFAGDRVEAGGSVLAGNDVEADDDVIAHDKLWVYGDADIDGNVSIGASVSSTKRLYVAGSSNQVALWAQGSWIAAHFQGDAEVTGDLTVGGTIYKSDCQFRIDHPLDPANKYLQHSCVESPEMLNIYNGNVTTDAQGKAWVYLPDWFEALNKDFGYQLTVIGQFAQAIVAAEIEDNKFSIQTDKPFVKVSWQVTAVRHDRYAETYPLQVEEEKPPSERGTFLHPELYGDLKRPGP